MPIEPDFTLLLAANHLNEALRRCRRDSQTRNLPNVVGAIEKKLRQAKKWRTTSPKQVVLYLIDRANTKHHGARKSFLQTIKRYQRDMLPTWNVWLSANLEQDEKLPSTGPGSVGPSIA